MRHGSQAYTLSVGGGSATGRYAARRDPQHRTHSVRHRIRPGAIARVAVAASPAILFVTILATLGAATTLRAEDVRQRSIVTGRIERRVVKRFDFTEPGNFTEIPRNWLPVRRVGFLRHNTPDFDHETGRGTAPSMRLSFDRGGIGAVYQAKDIDVHSANDYRITAHIRTRGLRYARAYVTAFYMDHAFRKIAETQQRSAGVQSQDGRWTEVTIDLPGGLDRARWIGLTCVIEQAPTVAPTPEAPRPIRRTDINGVAWFDDIAVLRLPRTTFRLTTPGVARPFNVFAADEPVVIQAGVTDPDGVGLASSLTITNADGERLDAFDVATTPIDGTRGAYLFIPPTPGRYDVRLEVRTGEKILISRSARFLSLGPTLPMNGSPVTASPSGDSGFGVILDAASARRPEGLVRLLGLLGPDIVQIPLWHGGQTDREIVYGHRPLEAVIQTLEAAGVSWTALLAAPPASLRPPPPSPAPTVVELLASDPVGWRPHLSLILARFGSKIRSWQIGADNNASPDAAQLRSALDHARTEIAALVSDPLIVAPLPLTALPAADSLPADGVSLHIAPSVSVVRLSRMLTDLRRTTTKRIWTTIEGLDPQRYERHVRLADYGQRMIAARANGADLVMVRQPWEADPNDPTRSRPAEDYLITRTIAHTLGGLSTARPVWLADDVTAYLFSGASAERGALAVWSNGDGGASRTVECLLGEGVSLVSIRGDVSPVETRNRRGRFAIGAAPVILTPVTPWLVEMQAGFALDDFELPPALEPHERRLTLTNPSGGRLRGELTLTGPRGFRIRPSVVTVDLRPGESMVAALSIRVPTNFPTGPVTLHGDLRLTDAPDAPLALSTPINVSSPGLRVSVLSHVEDGVLRVMQRVTNTTNEDIELRSIVVAPNRAREVRLIRDLAPGQSAIREFLIPDVASLRGEVVRVSVTQVGGPAVHNQIVRVESPRPPPG